MIDRLDHNVPVSTLNLPSKKSGGESKFEALLNQVSQQNEDVKTPQRKEIIKAARQMETHLVTMMLQTMEKSAGEGGLLGSSKSQGLSHFKDLFFQEVAKEVVASKGLGLAETFVNAYDTNHLGMH